MKAGTFDDVLQNLRWQDHVRGFIQILVDGDCAIPGKVQNVVIFEQQMIDNLVPDTYYFVATIVDDQGTESNWSTIGSATVQ